MQLTLIDDFAGRHHGLIHQSAAAQLGISRSSWYRAVDSGRIELLHPGVARVWGAPTSFEQRALAAVWAAGPDALASHRTAARLWGVERRGDDPIDIILPSRRRHSLPASIVVHRPRDRLDLRPIMRQKVPTTNPMRMLLDLGAVDESAVYPAMIAVLSAKAASPSAIRSALIRHSRKGRHGVTALRDALERWVGEDLPPDSALEAAMADLVRVEQLPPVTFHATVAGFEVDFLVDRSSIVLECDGWGSHGLDRGQFEFDRIRDSVLLAAGYTTMHFTWRQLVDEPAAVAARVRGVVERWAPHLLTPRRSG